MDWLNILQSGIPVRVEVELSNDSKSYIRNLIIGAAIGGTAAAILIELIKKRR